MQSQKQENDLCSNNAEAAEVKWFYEDLQDLLELTTPPQKEREMGLDAIYCREL